MPSVPVPASWRDGIAAVELDTLTSLGWKPRERMDNLLNEFLDAKDTKRRWHRWVRHCQYQKVRQAQSCCHGEGLPMAIVLRARLFRACVVSRGPAVASQ
jgi:hypothetical protein